MLYVFLDKAKLLLTHSPTVFPVQSCLDMTTEMEEYQSLTRCQKAKKVLPKVLPLLLLSVILPTADVGTDLALIANLYTGVNTTCVISNGMLRDYQEYEKCYHDGPEQYCNTTEKVSNKTVCGYSQYYCDGRSEEYAEYEKCEYLVGPDQYCTPEKVSDNVCGLKNSSYSHYDYYNDYSDSHYEYYNDYSDSPYFCRDYRIWSSELKDYDQCEAQGVDNYCSDPANNQNVCGGGSHPRTASSLLFFFLLNYVMGLVTCWRLEGKKWVPLIAALLSVYPQYCK